MAWIADGAGRSPDRSAARPGRFRRRLASGFATLAACLVAAAIAAAADPVPVPGVPGITAPAGLARDANGDLWGADAGGGICRLLDPPFAPLDGMACPPKALQGPKSPGQMAFDPASGFFFVGERATIGAAGVWRLHLNQATDPAFIDSATLLLELPAERVFGMAYNAATGALHYSTKDSSAIQRIANAATCVAPCVATTVGSAVANGVRSMVHDGDGRLYLADAPGVTRIAIPGVGNTQATLIPGFDAGTYEALAFDPAADGDGRIYAGTNNATGADWIDVLRVSDDAVVSRYSEGFAAVTAIGIDTRGPIDRALDVADDHSHKQFGEDTVGAGRWLSVPFELLGRPAIVDAPPPVGNTSTVTFGYTSPTDTTFWCSLDGGPALACGDGFASERTYPHLADGSHVFQVQSDNPITGGRTKRWFEIDTRAPAITLGDVLVNGTSAQIGFVADDVSAEFKCALDGGAPAPCESPARYANLAVGQHAFSVRATDFAGNAGSPVGATFHVVTVPVATPLAVTSPVVTPAVPVGAWKPGGISATLRGRTLRVVFDAPADAKFVRFTMTRKSASPVRTTAVRVRGGKRNVVQLVLPRTVALRLQGKRFTVTITSGATRGRLTTWAGTGALRIVAPLVPKAGQGR